METWVISVQSPGSYHKSHFKREEGRQKTGSSIWGTLSLRSLLWESQMALSNRQAETWIWCWGHRLGHKHRSGRHQHILSDALGERAFCWEQCWGMPLFKGWAKAERAGEGDGEKLERSDGATDFSAHPQPQPLTWPITAVLSWFANSNHFHTEESQGRILQIH